MSVSVNGVGKTNAYLHRYDSTLLAFVVWDGVGGGGAGASSTQVSVSSLAGTVTTTPLSTVWAGNAGFHFDGSGSLLTAGGVGGSSQVTISRALDSSGGGVVFADSANNALRVNVVAGTAGGSTTVNVSSLAGKVSVEQNSTVWAVQLSQYSTTVNVSSLAGVVNVQQNSTVWQVQFSQYSTVVLISGNSTVFQGTSPWVVSGASTVAPLAGSTWNTRPIQSSAADLQMTATPAAGSTWNVRCLQSSAADLNCQARVTDNLGNLVESSTTAGSVLNSTRRGLFVRQAVPDCTNASGRAAASGDNSIISSAANTIYVYAYSLSAPSSLHVQVVARFLSGSTLQIWRVSLGQMGSTLASTTTTPPAIVPNQMCVTPPGYLFRTAASAPLTLNITSSGIDYSVAAWRE